MHPPAAAPVQLPKRSTSAPTLFTSSSKAWSTATLPLADVSTNKHPCAAAKRMPCSVLTSRCCSPCSRAVGRAGRGRGQVRKRAFVLAAPPPASHLAHSAHMMHAAARARRRTAAPTHPPVQTSTPAAAATALSLAPTHQVCLVGYHHFDGVLHSVVPVLR